MMDKRVKLSAPWYTIHRELRKLFERDPEVKVSELNDESVENGGIYTVYISSDNYEKLCAIEKVLKNEYAFGNVTMIIKYVSENHKDNWDEILRTAFKGNEAVSSIEVVPDLCEEYYFVVFNNKAIQFFNDDIMDLYGNWNGLYTDIAKNVFKKNQIVKYTIKNVK